MLPGDLPGPPPSVCGQTRGGLVLPRTISVDYEYDVFLSYRRANQWPRFVDNVFLPMFQHWLEAELGRTPRIFFDATEIETGDSWPHRLAAGIGLSKIMVCLWSTEYFASPWCLAELAHMMARAELTRQPSGPLPLILALVIHGENVSPHLNHIQRLSIQKYANPWIAQGSPRAEELSERIRRFCVHVSHALEKAPKCEPNWSSLAIKQFVELFEARASQRDFPSLGGMSA